MSKSIKHWQDPVNLILGIWMIVSPWALQHQGEMPPTWNAVVLGILIAAAALIALFKVMAWEEWINVAFGVWLLISPWVLGFSGLAIAMWNAVIVGIVVAVLALWTLGTDKDIGGWWSQAA
ncbi:MAG TPA: SPW repeat protein [Casimicrobiaceae bacterium]